MVTTPPNCKLSGSNGKLPLDLKFSKKAKEHLNVPSNVRIWRRKLLHLLLVFIVAIGAIWLLVSFRGSWLVRDVKSYEIRREVQVEQHLNVSKNQHGLPSSLGEWNQVPAYPFHTFLYDCSWISVFSCSPLVSVGSLVFRKFLPLNNQIF